jgi:hypothetical protein
MPPYVLTESDQRVLADGLVRVLDQVLAEIAALPAAAPRRDRRDGAPCCPHGLNELTQSAAHAHRLLRHRHRHRRRQDPHQWCTVIHALRQAGHARVVGMKPVAAGCDWVDEQW